jgi:hypothetical protein
MTSDTTVSTHPKASGRLAHPRYSRHRRLRFHAGSWRERGSHDFGYCPIRPSEGFRQTGTFQVFPIVRRLSCQSFSWRGLIGGSSADPQSNASGRASYDRSCCLGSGQGRAIKTNTTCAAARGKLTRKLPTRYLPAAPGAQLGRSQAASL